MFVAGVARIARSALAFQLLTWLQETYGGALFIRNPPKKNHKTFYQWTIRSRGALTFLEEIEPFVLMKKRQIEIAIEFQRTKKRYAGGPGKVIPGEEIQWREEQRQKIRVLNGRNVR